MLIAALRIARQLLHVARHRLAQLVHKGADLLVRSTALQRILKLILQAAQLLGGIGQIAVFDGERHIPHEVLRGLESGIVLLLGKAVIQRAQREIIAVIVLVELIGPKAERIERGLYARTRLLAIHRQSLALLDERLRVRVLCLQPCVAS